MIKKDEILDKLNRAYEMEEEMAGKLISLSQKEEMPKEMPQFIKERIVKMLKIIKDDTFVHEKYVLQIKKELDK